MKIIIQFFFLMLGLVGGVGAQVITSNISPNTALTTQQMQDAYDSKYNQIPNSSVFYDNGNPIISPINKEKYVDDRYRMSTGYIGSIRVNYQTYTGSDGTVYGGTGWVYAPGGKVITDIVHIFDTSFIDFSAPVIGTSYSTIVPNPNKCLLSGVSAGCIQFSYEIDETIDRINLSYYYLMANTYDGIYFDPALMPYISTFNSGSGDVCSPSALTNGKQLDTNICLSLNVVSACKFTQSVFSADFGTISAGEVAEGMATVSLICSTGQNYTLLPGVDEKSIAKQKETYKAGLYKDVGKSNRLQRGSNGVFATGNGQIQTIPLYLKVTGQGKDFGKGNVFIEAAQINETYPIELAY